jgi:hypothetical protein
MPTIKISRTFGRYVGQSKVSTDLSVGTLQNGVAMPNASPKMTWATFIIVMIVGFAGGSANSDQKTSRGTFHQSSSSSFDSDPSGVWIAGDQSSVYSRLEIDPGGSFAFQTVDFTGDVKGG